MRISVVTASFNQGRFIQKCLDSVIAQRGNFTVEHIIMDNCSTDGTAEAIRRYCTESSADLDIRVTVEPDEGQTAAINKGFMLATGDIVCWLNTDEWYEPNAFAEVIDFFSKNPSVDVVFGNCDFVDVNGRVVKKKREAFYSEAMLIFYGCYIPSCSTFVRRKVIDDGIVLSPEFRVTMDLDWYVRIAKAGYTFAHMPATLASFTWHENNISSNFVQRRKVEKRLVQDRYSGIRGPEWFRTMIYALLLRFWLAVRVISRGRLHG